VISGADPWASASWEGAELAALTVGARMTLAQRLQWLEEATRAARMLANATPSAEDSSEVAGTQTPGHRSRS
jgi:hypothetical protein